MISSTPKSEGFRRFIDFFNLTQRERLDGLDKSYFDPMSQEEKALAFDILKKSVSTSEESVRGLYLCDPDKAIDLFKILIPENLPDFGSLREKEAAIDCKILMAGIVANHSPSIESINTLISLKKESISGRNRANLYKHIPIDKTTVETLEFLKHSLLEEDNEDSLSYVIETFLNLHGITFSIRDKKYKEIYSSLLKASPEEKISCIKDIESNYAVDYL